ncbi:MAG: hypothetical protein KDI03_20820 [Anaerolineae bacterium]|nr:hypothetical protein [Anaerolineae bacterium]MCB0202521.1 hypothetical protein [Anaerolineae bacterium]MCB0206973.1 hypothetical protein [Anaerolineae bacterium]MCB0254745.1 hypothetical protein [Anaerolineae bacterium]
MNGLKRTVRAMLIVTVLAMSLALLPMIGLPYQPLEATAARLNSVLYDQKVRTWLPLVMKNSSNNR